MKRLIAAVIGLGSGPVHARYSQQPLADGRVVVRDPKLCSTIENGRADDIARDRPFSGADALAFILCALYRQIRCRGPVLSSDTILMRNLA